MDGGNIEGHKGGMTAKGKEDPIGAVVVDEKGEAKKPVVLHGKELVITAEENESLREMVEEADSPESMTEVIAYLRKIFEKADGKKEIEEETIEEDEEMFS